MADDEVTDGGTVAAVAPADPHEKSDRLELIAAIVLGIAAVLTAWASFRGALISDAVVVNYSEMQAAISDATDWNGNGDQEAALEQQFFMEFALQATEADAPEVTEAQTAYLLELMGPEMAAAVQWWADQPDEAEYASPFVDDNPEWENLKSEKAYAEANAMYEEADVRRAAAEKADADSDRFEMANVFFAVTLFLAGVACLVADRRITIGLLTLGSVMMVIGTLIMVTTPGWNSFS